MEETLTDKTFNSFIAKEDLALVWFGVDWCGNCRRLEPILENLAQTFNMHLHKVIVDDSPGVAQQCDVKGMPARYDDHGVPTIILFQDGQEKGRVVGSLPDDVIVERITDLIG